MLYGQHFLLIIRMIDIESTYIINIYGRNGKAMLYCTYEYVFGFCSTGTSCEIKGIACHRCTFLKLWRNS